MLQTLHRASLNNCVAQMDTQGFYSWIQLSALIQYPVKRSPERLEPRCTTTTPACVVLVGVGEGLPLYVFKVNFLWRQPVRAWISPSNAPPQKKECQRHQQQQKSFHSKILASIGCWSPAHTHCHVGLVNASPPHVRLGTIAAQADCLLC